MSSTRTRPAISISAGGFRTSLFVTTTRFCLAAIRRAAAKLPLVLRTKTHVCTRDDGNIDFDLTIVADTSNQAEAIDYRAQLAVCARASSPRSSRGCREWLILLQVN